MTVIGQSDGEFVCNGTTLDAGAGLIGHNMYIYCANNPVNMYDPDGRGVLRALWNKYVVQTFNKYIIKI